MQSYYLNFINQYVSILLFQFQKDQNQLGKMCIRNLGTQQCIGPGRNQLAIFFSQLIFHIYQSKRQVFQKLCQNFKIKIFFLLRILKKKNGVLTDFPDCGVSNEITLQETDLRFNHQCWEACDWTDTPEKYRYKAFLYEGTFQAPSFQSFTWTIIFTEPRQGFLYLLFFVNLNM